MSRFGKLPFRGRRAAAYTAGLLVVILAGATFTWYDRKVGGFGRSTAAEAQRAVGATGAGTQPGENASASPSASPSVGPSASAPAPGTAARPPGGWPGPNNTGVPAGTRLSNYSGPCTITANNAVIDSKTVNCDLLVKARGVVIRKSKVNGHVFTDDRGSYTVTIEDTEVDAGTQYNAAVAYNGLTLIRANIHGGETSVNCNGNCNIRDSWLHGQYMPNGADWHLDAFLMNGGSNATLVHNTMACENKQSGCSGVVGIFGDFSANTNVTLDGNLFMANANGGYCAYGGSQDNKPHNADHIVYINNVFQRGTNGKCGYYGAITAFDPSRPGNVWRNNKWDDGTELKSSH